MLLYIGTTKSLRKFQTRKFTGPKEIHIQKTHRTVVLMGSLAKLKVKKERRNKNFFLFLLVIGRMQNCMEVYTSTDFKAHLFPESFFHFVSNVAL